MGDLEILLEGGPADTSTLARWLRLTVNETEAQLRRLERQGRVRYLRSVQRWALALAAPVPPARPAVPTAPATVSAAAPADRSRASGPRRTTEPADADGPALDDWIDDAVEDVPDLDDVDAITPRRPGRKPKALRQPPAASTSGPAWWVGLSREEHRAEADRRAADMSSSREARGIKGVPR